MQDVLANELLIFLRSQVNPQAYKIYSFSELLSALPEYLGVDNIAVKECLLMLNRDGYITVKYRDENEICLSVLDKVSERKEVTEEKTNLGKKGFSGAFLGGVTGGIIGALITFACSVLGGGKC